MYQIIPEYRDIKTNLIQMQKLLHKFTSNDINQLDLELVKTNFLKHAPKLAQKTSSMFKDMDKYQTAGYSRKQLPYYVVRTITCNK